ncbi:MAG: molybdate ABC transporter substrate-binding protein [Betaproteobacteria bacterium]
MKLRAKLVAAGALLFAASSTAQTVTVFAAASMKESLDDVARQFEAASGNKVVVSYAASSALAKQIEAGAPADIFISADTDWADYLDTRKLLAPGTRSNLLANKLVLIAPASSNATLRIAPSFKLAEALGKDRLAMANPDAVAAGKYGKAALEALGVWSSVSERVARAENVRAALALVSRGETPYGIVYRTDALADKGVKIVDTFPAGTHPGITYPVARIATSKAPSARALIEFMKADKTRSTWEKYGFVVKSSVSSY